MKPTLSSQLWFFVIAAGVACDLAFLKASEIVGHLNFVHLIHVLKPSPIIHVCLATLPSPGDVLVRPRAALGHAAGLRT